MRASHAEIELDNVLRAAGLRVSTKVPSEGSLLMLSPFDAATAIELTRLIRQGMKRTYRIVEALRTLLGGHGLEAPGICVDRGKIRLGDVSVPTADRLACLLGAPPQDIRVDLTEWPEAQQVIDRLGSAFKTATGGGFLDPLFHPDCLRCDEIAAVELGSIDVRTARRLVAVLRFGVRP
ncbi:hypothetical protein AB0O07_08470 [Streptomyces sp. NPDC093085]|uniref:hypothetical protein n=1 Tax=Streptomyces sp. NPDC093085 TaxID=3155068 RepID=UPI003444C82D